MSVSKDTQAFGVHGNAGTTDSVTITVAANSNKVLVAIAEWQDTGTATATVSGAGATWSQFATGTGLGNVKGAIWQGINPTAGAQTVTTTYSVGTSGAGGTVVYSMFGADQTTPLAGSSFITTGSQNISVTSGDYAISYHGDTNSNRTVTGCTTTRDITAFTTFGVDTASCTNSPTATFTWSGFNATGSLAAGVDVKQVSGGTTPTAHNLSLLGAGV